MKNNLKVFKCEIAMVMMVKIAWTDQSVHRLECHRCVRANINVSHDLRSLSLDLP